MAYKARGHAPQPLAYFCDTDAKVMPIPHTLETESLHILKSKKYRGPNKTQIENIKRDLDISIRVFIPELVQDLGCKLKHFQSPGPSNTAATSLIHRHLISTRQRLESIQAQASILEKWHGEIFNAVKGRGIAGHNNVENARSSSWSAVHAKGPLLSLIADKLGLVTIYEQSLQQTQQAVDEAEADAALIAKEKPLLKQFQEWTKQCHEELSLLEKRVQRADEDRRDQQDFLHKYSAPFVFYDPWQWYSAHLEPYLDTGSAILTPEHFECWWRSENFQCGD
ncbi:MAG: hypothetical protein Q9220_007570 [cf. Caloplaca sp. 1 TL-2023]